MDENTVPYTRFVVDGFDADALLGVVRDTRFEQRLLGAGHFHACLQRLMFPQFSLDSGAYSLPIFASGTFGAGTIALALAVTCQQPMWANGRWIASGQVMVFAEDSELDVRPSPGGWQWAVLLIPREVLQRAALARIGRELRLPERGWQSRSPAPEVSRSLRFGVLKALQDASARAGIITPDQLAAQGDMLLGAFVDAVCASDGGAMDKEAGTRTEQRRAALIRMAEGYLKSQLDRPFDIRGLSVALGLGERQVERLFRDAYGHGPCHWHQMARLNAARDTLLHAEGRGTVTDVAMRYGFNHLGRFSLLYRQIFSECPRETLRD